MPHQYKGLIVVIELEVWKGPRNLLRIHPVDSWHKDDSSSLRELGFTDGSTLVVEQSTADALRDVDMPVDIPSAGSAAGVHSPLLRSQGWGVWLMPRDEVAR